MQTIGSKTVGGQLCVAEDCELSIRLPIGAQYLIGNLKLMKGDVVGDVVLEFVRMSDIPRVFAPEILSAVMYTLQQEPVDLTDFCVVYQDQKLMQLRMSDWCRRLAGSSSVASYAWFLSPLASVSAVSSVPPSPSPSTPTPSGPTSKGISKEELQKMFTEAFCHLTSLSNPAIVDSLRKLEESYVIEVKKLLGKKESAQQQLHMQQSREMEAASVNSEVVSSVVTKHVFEMEALENKWQKELSKLASAQIENYRSFVIQFSQQERKQWMLEKQQQTVLTRQTQQAASQLSLSQSSGAAATTTSSSSSSVSPSASASSLSQSPGSLLTQAQTSSQNAITMLTKRFFSASPKPSAIGDSSGSSSSSPSSPSSSLSLSNNGNRSSPSSTTTLGGSETMSGENKPGRGRSNQTGISSNDNDGGDEGDGQTSTALSVALGNQLKSMHHIQLSMGRLVDTDKLAPAPDVLRSLYSQAQLTAVIFPVEGDLKYGSTAEQELLQVCRSHTEFHFECMDEQLENVRATALASGSPLQAGDFFITRHSNLYSAQVIFHLVADPHDSSAIGAGSAEVGRHVVAGMCNILSLCSHYGISTLTIPVFLLRTLPDPLIASDLALKRAQNVIRAVKAYLVRTCGHCFIRTIRFLLPNTPTVHDHFAAYDLTLRRVFQQTMLLL